MVVGWPVFIMSLVVINGLDNKLGDNITTADVYEYIGDCIVRNIDDTVYYDSSDQNGVGFVMVKYNVFTNDGDLIGIKMYNATDEDFYSDGTVAACIRNIETSQIMVDDMPYTGWLQLPMRRGTCIWYIVIGCLLICAPCVIALLVLCGSSD